MSQHSRKHHQEVIVDGETPSRRVGQGTRQWTEIIHPKVSLIGIGIFAFFAVVLFLFWSIPHHDDVVSLSTSLWHAILNLLTLALTWIAPTLLVAAAIGLVIKWNIKPSVECYRDLQDAYGLKQRNKVAAAMEHYTVVIRDGEPEFHPVQQPRITQVKGVPQLSAPQLSPPEEDKPELPVFVRYADIRHHIPRDHTLVGIDEHGVVSRERAVKGLIWVPGGSESGKSNTVGLRVEEDYNRGYRFLGVDPHAFKDDSLTNLVKPYMERFLMPIAYKPEDILAVLHAFLAEFEKRKAGGKCWPITLLYDEVGSQVSDKPEDEIEKQIIVKTKEVARVGGQEVRGFNMGVTMISQDAAGLAWLRKRALMVLGHKMLAMSERELVCNGLGNIAREMDEWPIGRTVVYGIAFKGVHVYQQPLFSRLTVDADPVMPELPRSRSSQSLPSVFPTQPQEERGRPSEDAQEAVGRQIEPETQETPLVLKKFLNEAGKMRSQGMSIDAILKEHGLAPGGRNNQNLKSLLDGTTGEES